MTIAQGMGKFMHHGELIPPANDSDILTTTYHSNTGTVAGASENAYVIRLCCARDEIDISDITIFQGPLFFNTDRICLVLPHVLEELVHLIIVHIGARFGELAPIPRHVNAFFTKYQDRILYGTDMGIDAEMYRITFRVLETADEHFYPERISNYHWPWHGFDLEDPVLKKIYSENARRLFLSIRASE